MWKPVEDLALLYCPYRLCQDESYVLDVLLLLAEAKGQDNLQKRLEFICAQELLGIDVDCYFGDDPIL